MRAGCCLVHKRVPKDNVERKVMLEEMKGAGIGWEIVAN